MIHAVFRALGSACLAIARQFDADEQLDALLWESELFAAGLITDFYVHEEQS
jgi:hypothetical protein